MVMCLLECTVLFFSRGGFCIGVTAQGTGAGHHFHLRPVALLVVCSGVAPPAPAHRRRLELKLLLGSLLHRRVFLSNIHYFFKCGRKVYFGFPRNEGQIWPRISHYGELCVPVSGQAILPNPFPFVFLNGILAPLPLWFSDGLHMLCSCASLLVAASLLPGTAAQGVSAWNSFQTL